MKPHSHDKAVPAPEPKLPPNCLIEPIEDIRTSFIDKFQKKRIEQGEKPAERAVFRKAASIKPRHHRCRINSHSYPRRQRKGRASRKLCYSAKRSASAQP